MQSTTEQMVTFPPLVSPALNSTQYEPQTTQCGIHTEKSSEPSSSGSKKKKEELNLRENGIHFPGLFHSFLFLHFLPPGSTANPVGKAAAAAAKAAKAAGLGNGNQKCEGKEFPLCAVGCSSKRGPTDIFSFFLYPAAIMAHLQKGQFLFRGQKREAQSSQKVQGC